MSSEPDRTSKGVFSTLRGVARKTRLLKCKFASRGKFSYGTNVWVGKNATIASPDFCEFADNVGTGMNLLVEANLRIGKDSLISSNVSFIGDDHRFDDPNSTVFWNGRKPTPTIVLEGDNMIGNGCTIIGPVTIGKGCIVGAGSLVTRDLPPYTICIGRPAKVLRPRYPEDKTV